ncbi:hypothetical protein MRY82_04815 [bacterium]|nr:hypothetical protein [bacterium]
MTFDRFFPNLLSTDIIQSQQFFCELLEFNVEFNSDWFIHLKSANGFELGILTKDSKIIPQQLHSQCSGTMLTFTVADVDSVFKKAQELGYNVVEEPTHMFYGQRRLLLQEEFSQVLVDISTECEPSKEFLDSLSS